MSQGGVLSVATGGGSTLETLTGNSGGAVGPDASFNIDVLGNNTSGINVVGTPASSTLTISGIQATTSQRGTVTLASSAQAIAGSDTNNAVTSAALAAKLGTQTAHSLAVFEGTSSALTALGAATNGQLPIGSTGADPVLATITAGTGISVTNGAGSITISTSAAAITEIDGDTGSASPSSGIITIKSDNATQACGSSVLFTGSGSTLALTVTDGTFNTIIGKSAGNNTLSGQQNTGLGDHVLHALTTGIQNTALGYTNLQNLQDGSENTAIGQGALAQLVSGSFNTAIGQAAGYNYTSSESSNICIGDGVSGTLAESNVLRIGSQGSGNRQQNKCFIAGIQGVTVSNLNLVTINTSTTQLGSQSAGSLVFSWTDESSNFNAAAGNAYFVSGTTAATLPASPSQGDTISFAVDDTNILTITANTGQKIRIGSAISAATGTAANNARGDSVTLVYRSTGATWIATSVIGTWTVT